MSRLAANSFPLMSILILALALRVWGLGWGLPTGAHYYSYHPDESVVLMAAMGMNVFQGQLLPHFYNYGSLQLYLVQFANALAFLFNAVDIVPKPFALWYSQWARMYEIGRIVTVVMGVGTVWATFAVGARLWNRRTGLLAALILAMIPLHVQHSHFLTVDVPATLWVMLSLVWTARLATGDARPFRAALWAGVFAGCAAATKYSMALVVLPLAFVCLSRPLLKAGGIKYLAVGFGAATAAFLIACPGIFLESRKFWADFHTEAVHVTNTNDPTFAGTGSGLVYHLTHNLYAGLGLPLLLLSVAAIAYAVRRHEQSDGLLAAFAVPYYIVIGLAAVRYARYVIPLLPLLALWGGRLLDEFSQAKAPAIRWAVHVAGGLVLLATLGLTARLILPMARTDPRDQALAWLNIHAPFPTPLCFPVMPWFGSPPVNPYFSNPRPAGWEALTPPTGGLRLIISEQDWDQRRLEDTRPGFVVFSEYDYRDALRRKEPAFLGYWTLLQRDYRLSARFGQGKVVNGLPLHDIPHDMLYTDPSILIFQRRP